MKTIVMDDNGVMYRNRQETLNVLTTFIRSQVAVMRPECAALSATTGCAHFDEKAKNLEGIARLLWGAVPLVDDAPELLNMPLIGGTWVTLTSAALKCQPLQWLWWMPRRYFLTV